MKEPGSESAHACHKRRRVTKNQHLPFMTSRINRETSIQKNKRRRPTLPPPSGSVLGVFEDVDLNLEPSQPDGRTHINSLPPELLAYIFTVGVELDNREDTDLDSELGKVSNFLRQTEDNVPVADESSDWSDVESEDDSDISQFSGDPEEGTDFQAI
jgi:hypothetical protein